MNSVESVICSPSVSIGPVWNCKVEYTDREVTLEDNTSTRPFIQKCQFESVCDSFPDLLKSKINNEESLRIVSICSELSTPTVEQILEWSIAFLRRFYSPTGSEKPVSISMGTVFETVVCDFLAVKGEKGKTFELLETFSLNEAEDLIRLGLLKLKKLKTAVFVIRIGEDPFYEWMIVPNVDSFVLGPSMVGLPPNEKLLFVLKQIATFNINSIAHFRKSLNPFRLLADSFNGVNTKWVFHVAKQATVKSNAAVFKACSFIKEARQKTFNVCKSELFMKRTEEGGDEVGEKADTVMSLSYEQKQESTRMRRQLSQLLNFEDSSVEEEVQDNDDETGANQDVNNQGDTGVVASGVADEQSQNEKGSDQMIDSKGDQEKADKAEVRDERLQFVQERVSPIEETGEVQTMEEEHDKEEETKKLIAERMQVYGHDEESENEVVVDDGAPSAKIIEGLSGTNILDTEETERQIREWKEKKKAEKEASLKEAEQQRAEEERKRKEEEEKEAARIADEEAERAAVKERVACLRAARRAVIDTENRAVAASATSKSRARSYTESRMSKREIVAERIQQLRQRRMESEEDQEDEEDLLLKSTRTEGLKHVPAELRERKFARIRLMVFNARKLASDPSATLEQLQELDEQVLAALTEAQEKRTETEAEIVVVKSSLRKKQEAHETYAEDLKNVRAVYLDAHAQNALIRTSREHVLRFRRQNEPHKIEYDQAIKFLTNEIAAVKSDIASIQMKEKSKLF